MIRAFRYLQNGLRRQVKEDLPEDPGEMVGLGDLEEENKKENADKNVDENQNMDMDEEEDEEVFVLANSQTEESKEEDNADEIIVLYEKSKKEMEIKTPQKRVGDATMTGEVWERMNRQANTTSSSSGFQDTTLAKVLSEATLSPGDNTLAGQMWRKYDAQADATHFQDTSLARVVSDAVPQSSEETKSSDGQTASDGDKTLLWRRYNEQADTTHFQDTTLCQILAKVVVSPENKSATEGKKLSQMGDKTMLNNMWADVNGEGEVTLMGRIEDELGNNETAADAWDLPSPLQSQVTKNVGTFNF